MLVFWNECDLITFMLNLWKPGMEKYYFCKLLMRSDFTTAFRRKVFLSEKALWQILILATIVCMLKQQHMTLANQIHKYKWHFPHSCQSSIGAIMDQQDFICG